MPTTKVINVGENSLTICRLPLFGWCRLEEVKQAMDDAISKKDFNEQFTSIVRFIEMASNPPTLKWNQLPWFELLEIYYEVININQPTLEFPILTAKIKDKKKLPWEYDGRTWYFWFNIFSKNYGWSREVIEDLDIDDALGLYQELEIDDQLQKEWQWGLSEIAFPYNSSTKKQEYKPLERPDWMQPIAPKGPVLIKIRQDMLPMGNIIDLSRSKNGS